MKTLKYDFFSMSYFANWDHESLMGVGGGITVSTFLFLIIISYILSIMCILLNAFANFWMNRFSIFYEYLN